MCRALLLVLLFACSSKRDAPKHEPTASTANAHTPATNPNESSPTYEQNDARDLLFVPASISKYLAAATTVFAIDFSKANQGARRRH